MTNPMSNIGGPPPFPPEIKDSFGYHKPDEATAKTLSRLRLLFADLAHQITVLCPTSRERALAITKLEEASMWAIKALVIKCPLTDDLP